MGYFFLCDGTEIRFFAAYVTSEAQGRNITDKYVTKDQAGRNHICWPRDWRHSAPNYGPPLKHFNKITLWWSEGFHRDSQLRPHMIPENLVSRTDLPPIAVFFPFWTKELWAINMSPKKICQQRDMASYTKKTIFPFPFTLKGIWSWWRFSFRFWFKIETVV